jgi:hypothetical protein
VRRAGGAFWATKNPGQSIRTVKAWDRTYLVSRTIGGTGTYRAQMTLGQRVRPGGALSSAWRNRVGSQWLLANEDPTSIFWSAGGPPAVEITDIPGLSGYLVAQGALVASVPFDARTSDSFGSMFVEVPLMTGRDMYDFDFSQRGGQDYMKFSSSVLQSAATVAGLSAGSNAVTIGAEGHVEWRRVPSASKLTVSGQGDWKLYDEDLTLLDSGAGATATPDAPAGAYLAVFGPAGSNPTVVVQ